MPQTILEDLLSRSIDISHSCGGMGSCGTCRIVVTAGLEQLQPRNEIEQEMASDRGFASEERLACQNFCSDQLRFDIPKNKII